MSTSGFTNAPVSKFLVFYTISSAALVSLTDYRHYFYILVDRHFWGYGQFWRIGSWQLTYLNSTEVLVAVCVFYQLRVIERLWGSRKFASFLLTSLPYTSIIAPFLLSLVLRPLTFGYLNYLPAGPTPLVFALLAQYHAIVPHIYKYRLVSGFNSSSSSSTSTSSSEAAVTLTSKSLSYLLPLQLALHQLPGSLISAAVGWFVGYAWRNEALPGSAATWRVPGWVVGESRQDGRSERFEGLRRRLEGEGQQQGQSGSATGVSDSGAAGADIRGRRTLGNYVSEQFRGTA